MIVYDKVIHCCTTVVWGLGNRKKWKKWGFSDPFQERLVGLVLLDIIADIGYF